MAKKDSLTRIEKDSIRFLIRQLLEIEDAILGLNQKQITALEMRFVDWQERKKVAEHIGVDEGMLPQLLKRAIFRLGWRANSFAKESKEMIKLKKRLRTLEIEFESVLAENNQYRQRLNLPERKVRENVTLLKLLEAGKISSHTFNCLRMQFETLAELAKVTKKSLLLLRGFGKIALEETEKAMSEFGYEFAAETSELLRDE
jgi:hypothetical protein